jgi:hypothetical protein
MEMWKEMVWLEARDDTHGLECVWWRARLYRKEPERYLVGPENSLEQNAFDGGTCARLTLTPYTAASAIRLSYQRTIPNSWAHVNTKLKEERCSSLRMPSLSHPPSTSTNPPSVSNNADRTPKQKECQKHTTAGIR